MTSIPSSGFGQYPGEPGGVPEQRTSVMAILSLVCSLICFIPGLAVLGVLFGVASLIAISRSGERLTGRGLSVAGLIIGLIVLALQVGIYVGIGWGWGQFRTVFIGPYTQTMVAIQNGDTSGARTILSADANKRITDADIDAFRAQYEGELGHFLTIPDTPMKFVEAYQQVAPQAQQIQGQSNAAFPMPAKFDKGTALVIFQWDPSAGGTGSNNKLPPIANIMIMAPSGSKWTLYDPQRGGAPGSSTPDTKPGETKSPSKSPKDPDKDTNKDPG